MKVIIAGSRSVPKAPGSHLVMKPAEIDLLVGDVIAESGWKDDITEVVSGRCPLGVDRAGESWAFLNSIPVTPFPADWAKHGKAAGPIRNKLMAEYADRLIAIWDGSSRGTKNMIDEMRSLRKPVFVYRTNRKTADA